MTARQLLRSLNNHKMVSGTYQIIAPSKVNCLKLNRTSLPKTVSWAVFILRIRVLGQKMTTDGPRTARALM